MNEELKLEIVDEVGRSKKLSKPQKFSKAKLNSKKIILSKKLNPTKAMPKKKTKKSPMTMRNRQRKLSARTQRLENFKTRSGAGACFN
jgi:hypothetical protein